MNGFYNSCIVYNINLHKLESDRFILNFIKALLIINLKNTFHYIIDLKNKIFALINNL